MTRAFIQTLTCAAFLGLAGHACAQVDLVSPETVHGLVDLRLSAANGESSFAEGGYGKARFGGAAGGGERVRASVAEAALEWKPRLNWEWSAVVDITAQPGQAHAVDVAQAYAVFKPVPRSDTRFQVRAGLFYPPISLEHDAPVWGTLYAPMLLPAGSSVDAAFGARPLYEADMLVRISDEAVNRAKTPQDVLDNIDQVIPFIELPDLVVLAPPTLNGAAISAINVGARLGIVGTPLPVQRTPEFNNALRDFVAVVKADGVEVDRGKGSDVLEHPLNAVVWLVQDMAREGRSLKRGDLISLGSFSKLLPPKPGLVVEVTYEGLPGNPKVAVSFK